MRPFFHLSDRKQGYCKGKIFTHPEINMLYPERLASLLLLSSPLHAQVVINEFLAANETVVVPGAVAGRFDDWIELHNTSGGSIDLGGWHLTDDEENQTAFTFPAGTTLPSNAYLIVFASSDGTPDANGNLHTGFKLSKSGEYLALIRPDLTTASEFNPGPSNYPQQDDDISFGLHPNSGDPVYFSSPTPAFENDLNGIARTDQVTVTPARGYYDAAQTITLDSGTAAATLYYTIDGAPPLDDSGNPTASAMEYTGPLNITQTTVLRAAAMQSGLSPSEITSHTYILLDPENAGANGLDPNGLNSTFLNQVQPAGYGALASGDYNMDPDVSRSTTTSTGHGQSVAQALLEGMQEIPTISISLPKDDFAGPNGIYSNPESQGIAWERECSAEYLPTANDTVPQFQENCGLRVQGGASREPVRSPKHSLSFRFRSEYGSGRLRQELFPDRDADEFNSIALRAGYNNSWIHGSDLQRQNASMIRDQWMRESMFDMGHPEAGAGFHVHLFINGLYWGVHNLAERQDNSHYAEYEGGDGDILDARNGIKYVQGNATSWNAMRSTVATKNWDDIQQVLDVDTYIDFQLLQRFAANQDLKTDGNWRAAGGGPFTNATDMRPWKLYSWDGERILEDVNASDVPLDPMNIRSTLESMPEYLQRFSDRARMHLTGDGALTPTACRARWEKYALILDKAIIAESARWGDHRRSTPYTRNDWLTEQSRLYTQYFPNRTQIVLNKLRTDGLLSDVEPPVVAIDGSAVETSSLADGSNLTLTGDAGTIYYTLDNSDPVLADGTIAPGALSLGSGFSIDTIFPFESSGWRYLNDRTALSASNVVEGSPSYDQSDWKHPDFPDSGWPTGQGLIGGPAEGSINAANANTTISTGTFSNYLPTIYFRKSFNLTDAAEVTALELDIIRDDGVIIYLNGREILRDNVPAGVVEYSDFTGSLGDEGAPFSRTYNVTSGDLREGENVLAIELHNQSAGNSDMGLDIALRAIRPAGSGVINLTQSATITARLLADGILSPPTVANVTLEPLATDADLAISEINYHPREASVLEKVAHPTLNLENRDVFEFIEVANSSSEDLNLFGLNFADGIDFQSGFYVLPAGGRAVIVRDPAAIAARYEGVPVIGTFSGGLDNDGETVTLLAQDGSVIDSLTYNDSGPWPSRPDGSGSSLERISLSLSPDNADHWAPSVAFHGSPGVAGLINDARIVINEVSSNSVNDFIELVNTTENSRAIGGWLLSDSKEVYRSFVIPSQTLAPGEYTTFSVDQFNAPATVSITNYSGTSGSAPTIVTSPAHGLTTGDLITIEGYGGFSMFNESFEVTTVDQDTFSIDVAFLDNAAAKGNWRTGRSFGLSSRGDDLWLLETDADGLPIAFVDRAQFAGADPDASIGRAVNATSFGDLITLTTPTPGAPNSPAKLGPVYLSEVHYAPTESDSHEFVEITNKGGSTLELLNWRLRGGVDFNFTAMHHIPADGSIILVTFDPANATLASAFRSTFGLSDDFPLIGPLTDGPLNDDRGTVRLERSGPANDAPRVTIDEVSYRSVAPWPDATNGNSLQRPGSLAYGNLASSWTAGSPTPGEVSGEDYPTFATANSIGAPLDDDDNDGLHNLLEFALGTDPTVPTSQPDLTIAAGQLTAIFPQNIQASGVTLIFETSSDLLTWSPAQTTPGTFDGRIRQNSYTINPEERNRLFFRLRAID